MIDAANITNYNLSDEELEEHILFWVCAAGKNGTTAARCLDNLLNILYESATKSYSPFQLLEIKIATDKVFYSNDSLRKKAKNYIDLPLLMKNCGIGCYNSKARTFYELTKSGLDLRTCSVEDLEKIYGIGMKTSRCFVLHTRKNAQYAGLDTHILKHLHAKGIENVTKATPNSRTTYLRLEQEFLKLAKEAGKTPANYDLMIWNKYKTKIK